MDNDCTLGERGGSTVGWWVFTTPPHCPPGMLCERAVYVLVITLFVVSSCSGVIVVKVVFVCLFVHLHFDKRNMSIFLFLIIHIGIGRNDDSSIFLKDIVGRNYVTSIVQYNTVG